MVCLVGQFVYSLLNLFRPDSNIYMDNMPVNDTGCDVGALFFFLLSVLRHETEVTNEYCEFIHQKQVCTVLLSGLV